MNMKMHRRAWCCGALLLTACAIAGCGSKSEFQFDSLDLVPAQEELSEVSLGKYAIPIPMVEDRAGESARRRNSVQFDFELIVVVKRDHESRIADSWERHEGKIRDRVIRVCRNASLDDLEELKAHLMDAVQAQLGNKEIRQLVIAEVKERGL
jgi:hypothetical protein